MEQKKITTVFPAAAVAAIEARAAADGVRPSDVVRAAVAKYLRTSFAVDRPGRPAKADA